MSRGRAHGSKKWRKPPQRFGVEKNGVDYTGASRVGCSTGKWGWLNREGAKTLARALRKEGSGAVRTYSCPECGRWHVGHIPFETRRGYRSANEVHGNE